MSAAGPLPARTSVAGLELDLGAVGRGRSHDAQAALGQAGYRASHAPVPGLVVSPEWAGQLIDHCWSVVPLSVCWVTRAPLVVEAVVRSSPLLTEATLYVPFA